jgi:hypothetical protein
MATSFIYTDNKNVSGNAFFGGAKAILDLNSSISVSAELLLGNMSYNQHAGTNITKQYFPPRQTLHSAMTFSNYCIYHFLYISILRTRWAFAFIYWRGRLFKRYGLVIGQNLTFLTVHSQYN